MTKCDCTLILRFSLIIRYHINAEWKIWNSAVHKTEAVWYKHLHLSSLGSWRGGICCAAPSLMSKIKISHGKRFADWTQEVCLEYRVGMLCLNSSGQWSASQKQPPWSPAKSATGRWVPIKCPPQWVPIKCPPHFLYVSRSDCKFYIFFTNCLGRYIEHVGAPSDLMHLKVPHHLL